MRAKPSVGWVGGLVTCKSDNQSASKPKIDAESDRVEGALREKIIVDNASHIRRWCGFPAKDDIRKVFIINGHGDCGKGDSRFLVAERAKAVRSPLLLGSLI